MTDVLIPAVTPEPDTRDVDQLFRVTTAGGFLTLHFGDRKVTLTKRGARRLAAALNKAAL